MRKYLSEERKNVSLDYIWQCFVDTDKALIQYEERILKSVISHNLAFYNDFIGLNMKEIRKRFETNRSELEKSTILSLIAATEAILRIDYLTRIQAKKKDVISKAFRKLFRQKGLRTALDKELLKAWKNFDRELESEINTFIEMLKFRHWIAHGRYWLNTTNKSYTPENVYLICDNLLNALKNKYIFYGI